VEDVLHVFRLLGSLELRDDSGRMVSTPRRKPRALLAYLLLRAGTPVTVDELVDALWGELPPASARANLHSYLSNLRQLLADVAPTEQPRPVRAGTGYLLELQPGECDADAFEELAADGRRALAAGRAAEAAERLSRALGLWRGPALEDLTQFDWVLPFAARLEQARLAAIEDQTDARLLLGQHTELAAELSGLATAHPFRERLWSQYMLALWRSGRRAQALAAYEELRSVLDNELGVEPGPAVLDLYHQIRHDEPAAPNGTAQPQDAGSRPTPALLPPVVADFTGRRAEREQLLRLLAPLTDSSPVGLTVVGVTGMAGVGKTTLAVQLAQTIAGSLPDGQLYVNLRGAGPAPLDPAEVLGRFLRALGVPGPAVPADPLERMELYRSLLSGRRALVVLDDAASEEQVRPLLPGAATCAVLVTSRFRLTGIEGARWVNLDVLPEREATQLLAAVVADRRVTDDPAGATEIVRSCGGLPLAVRIAGARLTARPTWSLAHLVGLLRDEHRRLDRLNSGDLQVRASLALSYAGLEPAARQLLRLLGLFDVPDFPGWLAQVVLGGPREPAARCLDALVDAHLLAVAGTDAAGQTRYRFHDLVRIFARERARAEHAASVNADALQRGYGAWLAIAEPSARTIPGPCYAAISGSAPRPPVGWVLDELRGVEAMAWFDAERAAIVAAIGQACELGLDEVAFDLAANMEKYFDLRGMYLEWEQTNRLVMAACQESGNRLGVAVMFRGLVDLATWITTEPAAEAMTNSYDEATRLLELFRDVGELGGMADAGVMCSWALTAMGRHEAAIEIADEALAWATRAGHLGGQAKAQVAKGVANGQRLRLPEALVNLCEALAPARELGNPRYEATVLQFLGIAHREGGQLDTSERFLRESLAISRRHRDGYTEVLTMVALARVHLLRADPEARSTALAALAVAREYRMSHHVADALGVLGEIELAAGRACTAVEYLRESVAIWRTRGWLTFHAAASATLGRALAHLDPDAACTAYEEARRLYAKTGDSANAEEMVAKADALRRNRVPGQRETPGMAYTRAQSIS
jgi:DNA-binding SARP family transcriptional activator